MIRIAICEKSKTDALRMRSAIESYATSKGLFNVGVVSVYSSEDLFKLIDRVRPDFIDIILCRLEGSDDSMREKTRKTLSMLAEQCPKTHFIVASSDTDNAICAFDAGAKFIPVPYGNDEFHNSIGTVLDKVAMTHKRPFSVKSTKGIVNMNLNDITFVETNKKGPIIHLPDSRTVETRGTLQALFERLSAIDDRFVRAGGSFIVNLDNVRTAGESSVIFGDGEAIILPIRARKPMQDAFAAYRLRT